MQRGVLALATHPQKTRKNNLGPAEVTVGFAGSDFCPGAWLYADADGLIVSAERLNT